MTTTTRPSYLPPRPAAKEHTNTTQAQDFISNLPADIFQVIVKKLADPRDWARLSCVSRQFHQTLLPVIETQKAAIQKITDFYKRDQSMLLRGIAQQELQVKKRDPETKYKNTRDSLQYHQNVRKDIVHSFKCMTKAIIKAHITGGDLNLFNHRYLQKLPEGLTVNNLSVSYCENFSSFPQDITIKGKVVIYERNPKIQVTDEQKEKYNMTIIHEDRQRRR